MILAFLADIGLRALAFGATGPHPSTEGVDACMLAGLDQAILSLASLWSGCLLFRLLTIAPQSAPGGPPLHIAVTVLSLLAALALWRARLRAVAFAAGLTVAALPLDGGTLPRPDPDRRKPRATRSTPLPDARP